MAGEVYLDGLDDPLQWEVSNTFSGGQVSNSRSILLQPNQYNKGVNIDLNLQGEATTRRGTTGLDDVVGGVSTTEGVQGMFWYSTSSNEYLVAVNNKKLYSFDGVSWNNFGAAWTNASTAMNQFAQLSNKLYVCNGTTNLFSWDGTTLTDLGNAANNQPPTNSALVVEHTNRLVVVGSTGASGLDRNTLYFSQFADGTVYDKAKWSIQIGDNDAIVAIKSWSNFNLLVFKRHSIWAVNCDPSLQLQDINGTVQYFEVKPIHRQLGCIAPLSVQQVGNDVFFLSQHGIYSINKLLSGGSDTEIGPDLSYPIHDIIDRIPASAAAKSAAMSFGRKYMLSVPLDNDTKPTTTIVWDDALQCFVGTWTGWNASCFAYCSPASGNFLRFGTNTGGGLVKEWLDYVQLVNETTSTYQDSGVDIPVTFVTRGYTFGGIMNLKTASHARFDYLNSLANSAIAVQYDRQSPVAIATVPGAGGTGIVFPLQFPITFPAIKSYKSWVSLQGRDANPGCQFAEVKFQITTVNKKFNLISIAVAAWQDTLDMGVNAVGITS